MPVILAVLLGSFAVSAAGMVALSQGQLLLPPHLQTYESPLPPGTRTQDITWASYLPPALPLHAVEGPPLHLGGGVRLVCANMSWQQPGLGGGSIRI